MKYCCTLLILGSLAMDCVLANNQKYFFDKFSNVDIFPFNDVTPNQQGMPVPIPQSWQRSNTIVAVRGEGFRFNATVNTCDDLEAAFDRYYKMIFDVPDSKANMRNMATERLKYPYSDTEINQLEVAVQQKCDGKPMPALGMNEMYKLTVTTGRAILSADTLWGALRGLETWSQLVYETQYESHGSLYLVNETSIIDFPRFSHRGFLIDTSRHYVEKNIILQFVSALAMAKYNVLHWHIVDSPSFPYRSRVFPNLSLKGAFEPYTHVYDHDDIKEVIEFARQRGIRVTAEFDTPGHSDSWGPGQPGLLTPCYKNGQPDGTYGPIDPSKDSTFDFIAKLFSEVVGVFPDNFLHLGGDEVPFDCWKSNPDINDFMKKLNITGNYSALESYYIGRVTKIVESLKTNYIVWQEPFDNGVQLAPDTVVNVWKAKPEIKTELGAVTKAGFQVMLSECWYLNRIAYGENWHSYYTCDPQDFPGTDEQKKLVMGGEACMWGEWVDGTNLMSRSWPRAAVVAERLWSAQNQTDLLSMKERLEIHRCRMIKRGLDANPIDPSYCRYEKQAPPPRF